MLELERQEAGRSATAAERRLVLLGPFPPPWGGISVHVRALRDLAIRHGWKVEVIDLGEGRDRREPMEGLRSAGGYGRFAGELLRIAAGSAILHVHVPGNNARAWMVALAASRAKPGGLLSVHSGLAPALLDGSPACRRLAWLACAGYERILCANREIAEALERCGVAPRRLEVLPAFLPGAVVPGQPPLAALAARSRFESLLAAAVAPGSQYGADVLLDALALLRDRHPKLGCVLYGPSTADPSFGEQVGRRGLFDRVVPLGAIDQPASLAVMQIADLFVRPTRADGDSIAVREALSLGVRVVASDVGCRPREAHRFRSGDPADLAARIVQALAQPPPPFGTGIGDSAQRILSAWRALGVARALREVSP